MMNTFFPRRILQLAFLFIATTAAAQKRNPGNPVYVDKGGVLRWTRDGKEAAFFGVNYTVPFAYGYRSHKALGLDLEKAIDADVHHLARLGLDAFRVHVWDVEISDTAGNLLQNEHLRLFDYLLARLKEKRIKILVTPIAFWGNGYPEPDTKTPGFATKYGKGPSVVKEEAFVAQENYLRQFFRHVNPYTGMTYTADPNVIAMEINNEPHHSGPRARTTEYVNRMAAAVRSTGWSKPVFYNISESPSYAGAVAAANVDGHSFQWYPTGLVANRELRGNFLPHVDRYHIPFFDSIPAVRARALMVYEFDAGDIYQSNMYPAMARAFRTAGFQWATQFAYDPMATAYANTEYQTHFLNLAYTPAKAISLLIAGKAFHRLPRKKSWGTFPADTTFDAFRVSYGQDLSEMNTEEEFYYTNNTTTQPKNAAALQHIAGVGSSPVVQYAGSGAYFLDKVSEGRWRLEVMPDAVRFRDPFGKASPSREAVRIHHAARRMTLRLPGLPDGFRLQRTDSAGFGRIIHNDNGFIVEPGVYELSASGVAAAGTAPFYAPASYTGAPYAVHEPAGEVAAGSVFQLPVRIGGADSGARASLELRHSLGKWKTVPMQRRDGQTFVGEVPAEMTEGGLLQYRVLLQQASGAQYTFPAGVKGNPYAWDAANDDTWQTFVTPGSTPLALFDATRDRGRLSQWTGDWRRNTIGFAAAGEPGRLLLRAVMTAPSAGQLTGWQLFVGDHLASRAPDAAFSTVVVRGSSAEGRSLRLTLIDANGNAVSALVSLPASPSTVEIPLTDFRPAPAVLLPRPYPGFQPLLFEGSAAVPFDIRKVDKLQCSFGHDVNAALAGKRQSMEVEWIRLR
ncbi:membrane or secreted protein [Flaviaesturariibacter amylovorans]|uniref:Membrane or secreted protein n=1 Tax=Flaviaesturariibacter amylovorans TaxID=1084520 RepID=A0ABP8H8G6_9BACT